MQMKSIFVLALWAILGFNRVIATEDGIVEEADTASGLNRPAGTPDTSSFVKVEEKDVSEDVTLDEGEIQVDEAVEAAVAELELSDALIPDAELKETADEEALKKFFATGLDAIADKFVAALGENDEIVDKMIDDVLKLMKKYDVKDILESWEDLPASASNSKNEPQNVAALKRKLFLTAFIAEMKELIDASLENDASLSHVSLLQNEKLDKFEEEMENEMNKKKSKLDGIFDSAVERMGQGSHDNGEETMKRMVTIFLVVGVSMTLITLGCYFFAFKSCLNLAHRAITVRAQNRAAREAAAGDVVPHTAP